MSTYDDQNWEDQWRKEIDRHTPVPSSEDWNGMNRLLDQNSPVLASRVIEQEPIGFDPWRDLKNKSPQLGWPIWIGLLLCVLLLGFWLVSTQEDGLHQEMNETIMARDSFPPHYRLNRYWTYDREGHRVGEMHSDTIWVDHSVRKRGTYALLSPGIVADTRIDTVLFVSGRGDLLSIRYDTVFPPRSGQLKARPSEDEHHSAHDDCSLDIVYRVDTTYVLDALGNLTVNIASIDSTIVYSPSKKN